MSAGRSIQRMPLPEFVTSPKLVAFKASPEQTVLLKVLGGTDPVDLSPAEGAIAEQIFGAVDRFTPSQRGWLAWRKGARVGGTLFAAYVALWLGLTCDLSMLRPGEMGFGVCVAPSLREAKQWIRYIIGAVAGIPSIAKLVVSESTDSLVLRRPDGVLISFECLPSSKGGASSRSRTYFFCAMDEADFQRGEDFAVCDREIWRSLAPRIVPGGMGIILSTAFTDTSLLAEFIAQNHGHPVAMMAAVTPTLTMRDDPKIRQVVEQELERDEANARREFFCVPLAAGAGEFFDRESIDRAADESITLPLAYPPGVVSFAAGDFGFKHDSSALVIQHVIDGRISTAEVFELRPSPGQPLVPDEVYEQFAARMKDHNCATIWCDGHYVESARSAFRKHGIELREAPGASEGKALTHLRARDALRAGKVVLPNHKRLVAQLRAVVSRPMPGGGISLSSPRTKQGHGDCASAWVLSCWAAYKGMQEVERIPIEILECGAGMADGWCGTNTDDPYEQPAPIAALRQAMRGTRW